MSKLKVDEIRSADRSVSDSANITLADDGSTTIPNGTLSAGTIGDNVNLSNKYYLNLKVYANETLGSGGATINTVGTTQPYFVSTGDTTNILPTDTNNIKIVRKGVYLVTFSATTYQHSATVAARTICTIRGGTSVNPSTTISAAYDNIASADSNEPDYSNATATYVGELPANYYLRFQIEGVFANDITIHNVTHASICLIRPTA